MPNTLLTNAEITYEMAHVFVNSLQFAGNVNRQLERHFGQPGRKIGDTISVEKPPRYVINRGRTAVIQDTTSTYVDLTLSNQVNITVNFTSVERTLALDQFSEKIIKPIVVPIANAVDSDGLALYYQLHNVMGTPGVIPNNMEIYNNASARLLNEATPDDDQWVVILNPQSHAKIASVLSTVFNPQTVISQQYRRGRMGVGANFTWYHDQNMPVHIVGGLGGTPAVNTSLATTVPGVPFVEGVATLTTDGWTAAAANRLRRGDTLTIANVYAVNPVSGLSTGELRQFVVTADVDSAADGSALVPIYPALLTTGAFKTVTGFPADNALITPLGAAGAVSPQNIGFHPNAVTLAFADLEEPKSGTSYRVRDEELGLSMRVWEASDIMNDLHFCRIDILYGWRIIYPEMMVRIAA